MQQPPGPLRGAPKLYTPQQLLIQRLEASTSSEQPPVPTNPLPSLPQSQSKTTPVQPSMPRRPAAPSTPQPNPSGVLPDRKPIPYMNQPRYTSHSLFSGRSSAPAPAPKPKPKPPPPPRFPRYNIPSTSSTPSTSVMMPNFPDKPVYALAAHIKEQKPEWEPMWNKTKTPDTSLQKRKTPSFEPIFDFQGPSKTSKTPEKEQETPPTSQKIPRFDPADLNLQDIPLWEPPTKTPKKQQKVTTRPPEPDMNVLQMMDDPICTAKTYYGRSQKKPKNHPLDSQGVPTTSRRKSQSKKQQQHQQQNIPRHEEPVDIQSFMEWDLDFDYPTSPNSPEGLQKVVKLLEPTCSFKNIITQQQTMPPRTVQKVSQQLNMTSQNPTRIGTSAPRQGDQQQNRNHMQQTAHHLPQTSRASTMAQTIELPPNCKVFEYSWTADGVPRTILVPMPEHSTKEDVKNMLPPQKDMEEITRCQSKRSMGQLPTLKNPPGSSFNFIPIPPEPQPILVNPKQYHRIMKRREMRERQELSGRLPLQRQKYLHESRHLHALNRKRGADGRFDMTVKEKPSSSGINPSCCNSSKSHVSSQPMPRKTYTSIRPAPIELTASTSSCFYQNQQPPVTSYQQYQQQSVINPPTIKMIPSQPSEVFKVPKIIKIGSSNGNNGTSTAVMGRKAV